MPHPPPPYGPAKPIAVNSSAFPSQQPTICLPQTQSCDQEKQGVQIDIRGDAIIDQMIPIPVSAPQAPPTAPKDGDGK